MTKRWKNCEDWFCKQIGCERLGHMGMGQEIADGQDAMFSYDVTTTKQKLAFINKEMIDAEAHAKGGRIPVVIIFQYNKIRGDGFAIVRAKDWIDLHGGENEA